MPTVEEIPYKWFEAFAGWDFLAYFGRPSAMGLQPHESKTVFDYIDRLPIDKKYHLTLAKQIITIDIQFVKAYSKKD